VDDIEKAQEREQMDRDAAIRRAAKEIPPGKPGECDLCGEYTQRLVNGTCAFCRDKWRLK